MLKQQPSLHVLYHLIPVVQVLPIAFLPPPVPFVWPLPGCRVTTAVPLQILRHWPLSGVASACALLFIVRGQQ